MVLDSNVWISALLFGGIPYVVMELAQNDQIQVFQSPAIVAEVEGILQRKFGWSETRIRTASAMAWRAATTDCADPDDNRVLECAVAAGAQFLVTGDRHLLVMHPYRGISIMTSRQFLDAAPWLPV